MRLRDAPRLAALILAGCGPRDAGPPPEPEAVPVRVVSAVSRDIPLIEESVGQTRGAIEVEIRARVEGFIDAVRYTEGRPVRKGEVLYEIDPKPYLAALNRAKGNLATAEADHARAAQDVARYKPLVESNAISREEYETSVALERAAGAKVDAARAEVESAELELGYTKVTSPIDGWAGRSEVKAGALVGRGQSTLLTTLSRNDPMHCRFSLSEREYLDLARRVRREGELRPDFELVLGDGRPHPHKGRFVFIERQVDPATGSILVEAAFPNPEGILRPGLFARVRFPIATLRDAVLVPARAVSELQATYSVAVVTPERRVEIRPVRVGPRVDDLWVVESGLESGERVVVEGLLKVRSGTRVAPSELDRETPEPEAK
jgi:membrane fusion protein (multidrug efflux system)